MAKKQVAVSLRKPPSPEKLDAFVAANPTPASGVQVAAPPEDSAPAAPGVAPALEPPAAALLIGADGSALRPVTVYLPHTLAERLTLHCIEHDRDMSNVIGAMLEQHLQKRLSAGAVWTQGQPEGAAPGQAAAPPRPRPFSGAGPFGSADPFRWTDAFKGNRRIEGVLQFSRVIAAVLRQRFD